MSIEKLGETSQHLAVEGIVLNPLANDSSFLPAAAGACMRRRRRRQQQQQQQPEEVAVVHTCSSKWPFRSLGAREFTVNVTLGERVYCRCVGEFGCRCDKFTTQAKPISRRLDVFFCKYN